MSVQPRPTDSLTSDYLQLGMPFVEFAKKTASGYDPYFSLGIIDSAEIARTLETAQLRSAQSGTSALIRELVRRFEPTLNLGVFQHSPKMMQLLFGSATLVDVSAGSVAVVDDPVLLTDNGQDFIDLSHGLVTEPLTGLSAAEIVDEAVGTGQGGTFGEVLGAFALDYKINAIGDVTAFTIDGVDRTADLVADTTPAAGEIGFAVGAIATSGQIVFPSGEAPANGAEIVATYEPSFALTENTHFVVDYRQGRVRVLETLGGGTARFRAFQPLEASYSYTSVARTELKPFTQFVFEGRTKLRLLTDAGINMVWTIPSTSIRLTDDAFAFNRDEFNVANLALQILSRGGSDPYGTLELYREAA
jgi:hypothetical protein